ncbi:MAG: GNAT family N-acetyltransferase, partial [Acidimicrobiia bacterium]
DRRDDTTVLGGSGLHARAGPDELEVGYWVHSDHHRRGIALELSAALTDAGFAVGCRNLLLACDVANTASEGVIRKLGYRYAEEVDGAAGALETTGRHKRFAISEAEWMLVRPALTRPNGQARGLR